ncbi:hypothetical protein AB6A40_006055 [Gnathostoma spinigerum]|uniref:BRO1 domain-containing protein n=1 Tax=Gnathostoma spinigerum TaxID=75299 RepID=A0ABD6EPJ2_9BILA
MAYWFHRNPLKATAPVDFELKHVAREARAVNICSELKVRRERLLRNFTNASSDLALMDEEFTKYMELLYGFLFCFGDTSDAESKLCSLIVFKWSSSMLGTTSHEINNAWFEVLNMCLNMAIWLTKHAAWVSAKDNVAESEAKIVHTCLRRAAGLFTFVSQNCDKIPGASSIKGSDFDSAVLSAYVNQCMAEAEEVTMARAIELNHAPLLISSLAQETTRLFLAADKYLEQQNQSIFGKWRKYLQLKAELYTAYAYAYYGQHLQSEHKAGDAIRIYNEGITFYKKTCDLCSKYAKTTGPGVAARLDKHLFYRRVEPILKQNIEKAERENNMIYHEIVPKECPRLESKSVEGLMKPEIYGLPKSDEVWNTAVYASFDTSKSLLSLIFTSVLGSSKKEVPKVIQSRRDLPPIKEAKIYETDRDPDNRSGCVVS